jgi:beta-barrel assembly-enhancing protease
MRRAAPVLAVMLAGCAPHALPPKPDAEAVNDEKHVELRLAYDHEMDKFERLRRVGYRLSVAAAEFCGKHVGRAGGFIAASIDSVPEPYRAAAHERYPNLRDAPTVIYVVPGSVAETAGLAQGDVITELNGEHVASDYKVMENFTAQLRKAAAGPLHLDVRRAGAPVDVTLQPARACDYPFHIVADPSINAFADGDAVFIADGMMEFVQSDDELAVVLGHEMAHDFRGHIDAKRRNAIAGMLVGVVIDFVVTAGTRTVEPLLRYRLNELGTMAFSKQFEAEADYVGLYVMARAGYPIDGAAQFWRRMAVASPGSITMARDHPPTPERFVALNATIAEIEAKEARGEPLVPNEKPGSVAATQ